MSYHCFKCQKIVALAEPAQVGRRDTCPACSADLHVCLNCKHYDRSAYNQCHEPQADRVLDKDRSNFCDYFYFRDGAAGGGASDKKATLGKLEDLFK